ncbi:MAG: putative CtpA-like serine protease [Firmicutes bacterium]|nr:putative CtpA-like serine protease [Bacillota bacterium]
MTDPSWMQDNPSQVLTNQEESEKKRRIQLGQEGSAQPLCLRGVTVEFRKLSRYKLIAMCAFFLVVGLFLGAISQYVVGPNLAIALSRLGLPINPQLSKLIAVQNLVLERHVSTELDPNVMMENAIRGMLTRVDGGYTRYESPDEARETTEQGAGEYSGIGVSVRMVEEQVHIEAVFRGTPAHRAGLLPRDIIISVNGENIRGLLLRDITGRIKGLVGTDVELTIFRPALNSALEFKITRARIIVPVVESTIITPRLAHVILTQFTTTATDQMRQTLLRLEQDGVKHILLDLRFNPGGHTSVVEAIADFFLDPNLVIYKTIDRAGEITEYRTSQPKLFTGDVSVLVNQGSASASEILAGALRDHRQAKILGTTTFGKGTVQQGFSILDGSRVWVTVQTYRTPAGVDINKAGIVPDVVIEPAQPAEPTAPEPVDTQLRDALKYIQDNLLK